MAVDYCAGSALHWPGDDLQRKLIRGCTCLRRCVVLLSAAVALGSDGCHCHVSNDACRLSALAALLIGRYGRYSAFAGNCIEVWSQRLWRVALVSLRLIFLVSTERVGQTGAGPVYR